VCIWPQPVETPPGLIPTCKPRKNSLSRSQTINNVGRTSCLSFALWRNDFTPQPSGSSAKTRATVVSEWLGKCYFRIVTFNAEHRDVFRSAINAPTTGNTYAAFVAAAKALGANEIPVGCSLFHKLSVYLQFLGRFPAF
jgi:hypothetical protein